MAVALVLTVAFSGCSKDSAPIPAEVISKVYTGADLTVTNGGELLPGGTVTLEAIDNITVKVTLDNIVNGQASFKLNAAVAPADAGYTFSGTDETEGMNVSVNGVVIDGKAAIDVAIEISGSDLLNAWTFNTKLDGTDVVPDFVIFNLQNKSGKAMFGGTEVTTEEYNEYFNGWITIIGAMSLQNLSLTFNKDGYVGLTATSPIAPEGQQNISLPKLARYYYSPAANLLVFDAPLDASGALLQIPFKCTVADNVLTATILPNFLTTLLPLIPKGEALEALLTKLDTLLPPDFVNFAPIIKMLITDLVVGVTDPDLTSLSVGAKLQLVPAAPAE